MYERKTPQKIANGVDATFYVVGGKWKPDILQCVHQGIRRPSQLQKTLTGANARVLNQQIKELETSGIIFKKIYPVIPVKVEYYLTDIGNDLIQLLSCMEKWGTRYREKNQLFENGN